MQNAVRLKTWLPLNGDVDWLSNLTIPKSHKQSADKFCIVADVNEFVALNDNHKSDFGTLKISRRRSNIVCLGFQKSIHLNFCQRLQGPPSGCSSGGGAKANTQA